jgi:hypothetical protein
MAQRLHRESGRSSAAPTALADATTKQLRLFDAIADQWRELQLEGRKKDWKWMRQQLVKTLTANQARYTGADFGVTKFGRWRPDDGTYDVRCAPVGSTTSVWHLKYLPLDTFKRQFVDITPAASTPIAWAVDDDQTLWLGPTPAQAYGIKVDVISQISELAADADEPDMPSEYHMLLVWGALKDAAVDDAAPEAFERGSMHYRDMRYRLVTDQARLPTL